METAKGLPDNKNLAQPSRLEFVEVLLPLPLEARFTYRLPAHLINRVLIGCRVIVPFGLKKFYTAIVVGLADIPPKGYEIKEVALLLDEKPIVRHPQLKLWNWVSEYYLAAIGDVYKAAIPAGLKIESETFVELNPDLSLDEIVESIATNANATQIIQLLHHEGALTPRAIESKLKIKAISSIINSLIAQGVLIVAEKLNERYRPKKIAMIKADFSRENISEIFTLVSGAKKQETLLLAYLELSGMMQGHKTDVSKEDLLNRAQVSPAILSACIKKGIFSIYHKEFNRFEFVGEPARNLPQLSNPQKTALKEIQNSWRENEVVLLHGVTSSGKTEIYIHLIQQALELGNSALFLVPEIALTTQLTRRLQNVFGTRVIIYHSKFSDSERVDIWKRLVNSAEPTVIIGARSAVFLPFAKLGLVIVDEEHESSYKQYDPAPRYNGRDVAIMLAKMHGAKTLLGSATPSVESYYKATIGKFGLVSLTSRYGDVKLPEIRIVDMKSAHKNGCVKGVFATETLRLASDAIANGSQIILFQNRRGYAPLARCKQCAWVPRCNCCDVSLTYHRHLNQLQCHYCGAVFSLPKICPQCHEPSIEIIGYGTERIEEEVAQHLPGKKMLRMDLDTTRSKDSYAAIIDEFSDRKADILVGTQMVSKGLDFGGVSLVGILNADSIINFPDFRSSERAFNMIDQVAGRAGRRSGAQGKVVIQTFNPESKILEFVKSHNYEAFYTNEIAERKNFTYPPFARIVNIYLRHKNATVVKQLSEIYANHLKSLLGSRVYGPEDPIVGRIQSLYIKKIMLKIETNASMIKVKQILKQANLDLIERHPDFKQLIIHFDVDPN